MITVLNDPAGIANKECHPITEGMLLIDWCIDTYGPDGFHVPTQIFKDRINPDFEIHLQDYLATGYILKADDNIIVVHTPQGVTPGLIIGSLLVSFAVTALLPTPSVELAKVPETPEFKSPTESPNNSLTGQTNIARPLQRIPDIFGQNKVWPDLILPSYFIYINHIKTQFELMCIGRGEYTIDSEDLKTGDTALENITDTTSTIFGPSASPSDMLKVIASNEVNGQELFGPNEPKLYIDIALVEFATTSTIVSTDPRIKDFTTMVSTENFSATAALSGEAAQVDTYTYQNDGITATTKDFTSFSAGDYVTITGTVSNNGDVIVASLTETVLTCINATTGAAMSFTTETVSSTLSTTGSPNILAGLTFSSLATVDQGNGVTEYTITVTGTPFAVRQPYNAAFATSALYKDSEIGPFNVPGNPDQIWIDIQCPRGLMDYGGTNDKKNISFTVTLQEVDGSGTPVGGAEVSVETIRDSTRDPRFYTIVKIPDNPGALHTVSVERTTDNDDASDVFELTKWTRLAGVEELTISDYGDVTTWQVITVATEQAVKIQERKYNAIVERKLSTYDRINDDMTTPKAATSRVADAVVEMLKDSFSGNKAESEIDLLGLYDIQDVLDSDPGAIYGDALGRFCYSFSNARTPIGDEIDTALKAARMFRYQEGNVIKFGRDETQSTRKMLINRRVKKPDSEQKSIRQFKVNDFDGIDIQWISEDTGDSSNIIFPESPAAAPDNPQRIDATGIKNYDQAWNRGQFEYDKLIYRRTTVTTTVLRDGLIINPNDRIGNVDSTTLSTQDGEVIGVSSLTIETSEPIDFEGNPSGTVIMRDEDGVPDAAITCTARTDGINGFILGSGTSFTVRVRGDVANYQMGTLYAFSPDSNHDAIDYLVQEIAPGSDNGYVELTLINYVDDVYDADTTTPT